ncbi:MAG: InlB B-repeat-containing protein, partial [Anaerovoracaceae bacterium]
VTIKALWSPNSYMVVFDSNDGKRISGGELYQTVLFNSAAVAPVLSREGYNFIGWDKAFDSIKENTILKASWEIKKYSVTFDLNEGELIEGELEQIIEHGSDAVAPSALKVGYTFKEWDKATTSIKEAMTIKAIWDINSYPVTFNLNGGARTGGGELVQSINYEAAAIAPEVERVGYDFIAWDKEFSNIKEEIIVKASWGIKTFKVSFDVNGGTRISGGEESQTVNYGAPAVAPTVERIGYTFLGWDNDFDSITEDITITANWLTISEKANYNVTFIVNGGKRIGGAALAQSIQEGGAAQAPILARTGYKFVGWDKALTNIQTETTVKALWKEITASSVKITGKNKVKKGKVITLKAAVYPNTALKKKVTWTSSNKKIAKVTSSGKVKGLKKGKVKITAKAANGVKKVITIRVY